ncbi:MAG TPA: hypothetical protein VGF96_00320 [Terracidiphilus sp.]|jgi:hypothetical protein
MRIWQFPAGTPELPNYFRNPPKLKCYALPVNCVFGYADRVIHRTNVHEPVNPIFRDNFRLRRLRISGAERVDLPHRNQGFNE